MSFGIAKQQKLASYGITRPYDVITKTYRCRSCDALYDTAFLTTTCRNCGSDKVEEDNTTRRNREP